MSSVYSKAITEKRSAQPIRVVSTIPVINDMVMQIGGDHVEALALIPPDKDPHVFDPTPADAATLSSATLVIINGLELEGWVNKLIQNSGYRGRVVSASDGIDPLVLPESKGNRHAIDPHAWLDIYNGIRYVKNIRDALVDIDVKNADDYNSWAGLYIAQLRTLDAWCKRQIAAIPLKNRRLVTSHDAFSYFARRYGFEIKAISGVSHDYSPNPKQIADVIDYIRTHRVKGIFVEHLKRTKVLEQIARETGVYRFDYLHTGTSDPVTHPAGSYIGLFKVNIRNILRTLK